MVVLLSVATLGIIGSIRSAPQGAVLAETGRPATARPVAAADPDPGPSDGASSAVGSMTGPTLERRVSQGAPAILSWTDSFGRRRLQIILPIHNDGDAPLRVSEVATSYRLLDGDREVARGSFVALPPVVEPGATGYLVDTRADAWAVGTALAVRADVVATVVPRPDLRVTLVDLRLREVIGGGMGITAKGRNDGARASGRVVVGAIALDATGRPIGAVVDRQDIRSLAPGATQGVVSDVAAGAPPVVAADVASLIGVAFEEAP